MRSTIFASTLAIALGIGSPIVGAIAFPEVAVAQSVAEQKKEADRLFEEGRSHHEEAKYEAALKLYQQSLQLYQVIKDRKSEGKLLTHLGIVYNSLGKYDKAIEYCEQGLAIAHEIKDRLDEANSLGELGDSYLLIGNYVSHSSESYSKAVEYYIKQLEITREIKNQLKEQDKYRQKVSFESLNLASNFLGNYIKTITFYEQSLEISRKAKDLIEEEDLLRNLGDIYYFDHAYEKSIQYYEQRLSIARKLENRKIEAFALLDLGKAYRAVTNYGKAVEYYEKSLVISREIKDKDIERRALYGLGDIHNFGLSDSKKFIEYYEQDSTTGDFVELFDQKMEEISPGSRRAYIELGKFRDTFEYHEKRLLIARSLNDLEEEKLSLGRLILLSLRTLDYRKVIYYQGNVLEIARKLRNKDGEINALEALASYHNIFSKNVESIESYEQILIIAREAKNQAMEARTLKDIGDNYYIFYNYRKTIEYYENSLAIDRKLMRRRRFDGTIEISFSGDSLKDLGYAYDSIGNHTKALEYYQQSLNYDHQKLVAAREQKDRRMEAYSLQSIGVTLVKLKQPELAIVFYKQSVNARESIREDIRNLPRQTQEAYAKAAAATYRELADLLIQQRRLPEAQAVLELLKIRELRDFTRDTKAIDSPGISLAKIEKAALTEILTSFSTIGQFTETLQKCEKDNCPTLTELQSKRDRLNEAIKQELKTQRKLLADHYATESATLTPEALNTEARRIVNAKEGTVLIYPLILKDKLQFLLAFKSNKGGVTFRPFESAITAEQLTTTITRFRNQLEKPGDIQTLKTTSQTLYNALIKPLEPELKAANIKHLVFAPDSTIRYIPLAALHDGKNYLIERYTISTITAASKTDTQERSPIPIPGQNQLLAMGASTFPNTAFSSLLNVPIELDAITQTPTTTGIYPGTEVLDRSFNFDSLKTNLKTGTYKILHLATHGAFIPGNVEQSYIVPGSGPNLTTDSIDTLANYGLGNLHLVVLSACQTGVGDRASDGIEIPGISHFFLKNDVKSVLASLWNVSDASTALLMQKFYTYLAQGKTKAEALQQVQTEFLNSKLTTQDLPRAGVRLYIPGQLPPDSLAHPYYWAPFILIGNSL